MVKLYHKVKREARCQVIAQMKITSLIEGRNLGNLLKPNRVNLRAGMT